MKSKWAFSFTFAAMAIVLILALIRGFDFETYTFEKPALAIVYIVTLIAAMILTFRKKTDVKEK